MQRQRAALAKAKSVKFTIYDELAAFGNHPQRCESVVDDRAIATTISLPSGEVSDIRGADVSPPAGFDEAVWKTGLRFSPAGLMDVETSDVVSSAEPERYDVLPSQFGLAQLAGQGKLEAVAPNKFRILGEFSHYPAGLSGAHSVTFLLPEGVPEPSGSPGHSRVERELAREHAE